MSINILVSLDIGTEFVKVLIAKGSRELDIIGIGRAHQEPTNMYGGAISDIPAVVSCCERALSDAEKMAEESVTSVVVGIAGELVKGITQTIRYHRSDSRASITEDEMRNIIKKAEAKMGANARAELAAETDSVDAEVRLINSAIVSMHIDGHKVTNPIGFKGSDVEVQLYTAFAPLVHISAIENVCEQLQLDLVAVAVEPFAVCRAILGDNADSTFSGIVMDIGGGTTDIAVVDDGGVEGTKMFGIGGRSFTHQIAEQTGTSLEDAETLKLHLEDDRMDEKLRTKLDAAIERDLAVWISGVQIALAEFENVESLPTRILLCGGGASLMALQEMLATSDWYDDLAFSRRPIVHLLDTDDVPNIKNTTGIGLDQSFATAFGLLRIGVDTLVGAPTGSGLRAKIAKLLSN